MKGKGLALAEEGLETTAERRKGSSILQILKFNVLSEGYGFSVYLYQRF